MRSLAFALALLVASSAHAVMVYTGPTPPVSPPDQGVWIPVTVDNPYDVVFAKPNEAPISRPTGGVIYLGNGGVRTFDIWTDHQWVIEAFDFGALLDGPLSIEFGPRRLEPPA